jgi:outer membrane lipoprotein-sorting protein
LPEEVVDVSRWGSLDIVLMVIMTPIAIGGTSSGDTSSVLQQLDAAAARFQTAQADISWDQYVKVVDEHEVQSGTIYYSGNSTTTQVAVLFTKPDAKSVVFKDGIIRYYQPKIDQLTVISASQNRSTYESFLGVGFGASGKDLETAWNVSQLGTEQIGNVAVVKLELRPKKEDVQQNVERALIWVDPTRDISLKQVFYSPGGDVRTVIYTNLKYNLKLSPSIFTIKTTAKTQTLHK